MTVSITKGLVLCGLCALFASAGSVASAQDGYGTHHDGYGYHQNGDGDHHGPMHHSRQAIMRAKMAYGRAVAHGNYQAARRAHLRARAIRHHMRARRMMMGDGHGF